MILYVYRRLFIIGGLLFLSLLYFWTLCYSLIGTGIYVIGAIGFVQKSRKEVRHQLGLVRYPKKWKRKDESNHVNCNDSSENHNEQQFRFRNVNQVKDFSFKTQNIKTQFNSFRYTAPALSNAVRMTLTARRHYPTHQEKYSMIGQFPIVHLKKESLPVLKNRNTTMMNSPITVKIAPPEDYKPSHSRWKFIYISPEKEKSRNDPCDAKTVIAALKETRKRVGRSKEDFIESRSSKRQRRDSNSSSGSAFTPTNPPATGTMAITNTELITSSTQKRPATPDTSNISISGKDKRTKNNAISSSYSSSKRIMEKMESSSPLCQLAKRKAPSLDSLTPRKVVKIADSQMNMSYDNSQNTNETSQSDQNFEKDRSIEKQQEPSSESPNITAVRKGISYRRTLPIYTSLGTHVHTAPIPAHLPTLEEHERDKKIEEKRLEWLLSGVKEAFQNKDGVKGEKLQDIQSTNYFVPSVSIGAVPTTLVPSMTVENANLQTSPVCSISGAVTVTTSNLPISVSSSVVSVPLPSFSFGTTFPSSTADNSSVVTETPNVSSSQPNINMITSSSTITTITTTTTTPVFSTTPNFCVMTSNASALPVFGVSSSTAASVSSDTMPQVSLSCSTVTTSSITVPISSPIIKSGIDISSPTSFPLRDTAAKTDVSSASTTSNNNIFTGLGTSSKAASFAVAVTKPESSSGGFHFNLQPNSQFSNVKSTNANTSVGDFTFPLQTTASVISISSGVSKSGTSHISSITSPNTTSSNVCFPSNVTSTFIIPSNISTTTTVSTINQTTPSFTLGSSTKPFVFGTTNEQNPFMSTNTNHQQTTSTPITETPKNIFGSTFGSPTQLIVPNAGMQNTTTALNPTVNNSFSFSQNVVDSPNKTVNPFATGNTFGSNINNPFGTNNQTSIFAHNQTNFENPNAAVIVSTSSQPQIPKFGSNQSTFGCGNTSQSAFMTPGQVQPMLEATNTLNASNNTFGNSASVFPTGNSNPAPFQFGSNAGRFNFNFTPQTKYNFGTMPSFGTQQMPAPSPGQGGTLFSIGSGKMDRKVNPLRRRTTKK